MLAKLCLPLIRGSKRLVIEVPNDVFIMESVFSRIFVSSDFSISNLSSASLDFNFFLFKLAFLSQVTFKSSDHEDVRAPLDKAQIIFYRFITQKHLALGRRGGPLGVSDCISSVFRPVSLFAVDKNME